MITPIPRPSEKVLRKGDIYLQFIGSSIKYAKVMDVSLDEFKFRYQGRGCFTSHAEYGYTQGIFLRENDVGGLDVVAVSNYDLAKGLRQASKLKVRPNLRIHAHL
jgi:hypothetical protein